MEGAAAPRALLACLVPVRRAGRWTQSIPGQNPEALCDNASDMPHSLPSWLVQPFEPIASTIRSYRVADFPHDLRAGLTVSVVDIPQSMAFAMIAGVPPVYGIYTAILLALIGALFSSSRFLSVGPTNTQSLLTAAIVSRLTGDAGVYVQLAVALSLVKGVVQLGLAAAGVGQLARFVSRSVMIGFTAGAAALIAAEQLPPFLGVPGISGAERSPAAIGLIQGLAQHLGEASVRTSLVGALSLAVMLLCRRVSPRLPGPLLAVAAGAAVVSLAGWSEVPLVGALPKGLPELRVPELTWQQAELLLPGAVAIALLGLLESVAIAKSLAQRTGQDVDADQELFGQGLANLAGSFFQCIPGSGSFSRTALQHAAGARTRVAGVVCAAGNALIFVAFAPAAERIPLASLAAILLAVAVTLVDAAAIRRILRTSRAEAGVCLATLAAALLLPLAYSIYTGILLSIALHLRRASRLRLALLAPDGRGGFRERIVRRIGPETEDVIFLQLQGDLFFGVGDELAARFREVAASGTRVAVLRLKRTHSIDATVLFVFEQLVQSMRDRGGHVVLCGVLPEVRDALRNFGIEALVGEENVFDASAGGFGSARRALARAREILESAPRSSGMVGADP